MKVFLDNAPDAYFNIKLMLDTRPWYLAMHPECLNSLPTSFFNCME